jgi:hypothetical protein
MPKRTFWDKKMHLNLIFCGDAFAACDASTTNAVLHLLRTQYCTYYERSTAPTTNAVKFV